MTRRQFLAAVVALPAAVTSCVPEPVTPVVTSVKVYPKALSYEQSYLWVEGKRIDIFSDPETSKKIHAAAERYYKKKLTRFC